MSHLAQETARLREVAETMAGRLRSEIGAEHVSTPESDLDRYYDPFPVGGDFLPSVGVRPGSVEEVQTVVAIANEEKFPLWAVSQGRNNGYGGGGPRLAGAMVMDLRRMNRILDVDEVNGTALVEPGVRFFDMYEELTQRGRKWWSSVPDLGWGSLIGNAMDRGFGYTPYGGHNDTACGLEVVLPNGELVRTGMGAMEGSKAWQLYKHGFGPGLEGLFAQSGLGVVTKMGLTLQPRPEEWAAVDVIVWDEDQLAAVIDTLRPLRIEGTVQSNVVLGETVGSAAFFSQRSDWYDGDGPLPEDVREKIIDHMGMGRYFMTLGLYDHSRMLDERIAVVRKAFEAIPSVEVRVTRYAGDASREEIQDFHETRAGIAGMNAQKLPEWWGGGGGHIGLSPVTPIVGAEAVAQIKMFRKIFHEHGFDYAGSFTAGQRYMAHVVEILFDHKNESQTARAHALFEECVRVAAREGYGEYRTHVAFMDLVQEMFGWNNHAQRRLQEQLKDTLDPNGIMSPGKSGIWPARLRSGSRG